MKSTRLRIAAAVLLAGTGIAVTLVSGSATATARSCSFNAPWAENGYCIRNDGDILGISQASGSGSTKKLSVILTEGTWAVAYGLQSNGGIMINCSARDEVQDDNSVSDSTGCQNAIGHKIIGRYYAP